jgi:excisionase family DNA binding protein
MKRSTHKRSAAKREAADVMSVDELAARLGIGRNQAYALVQLKHIPALRFGRRWLISRQVVDRILAGENTAAA